MNVTFNKFNSFTEALAEKKHNLGSDALTIALTDTAPSASNTVLADITQISYTNLSSRAVTISTSAQTSGVYKLVLADLTLTASATIPTFRYIVLYNDTAINDELICYGDIGSEVLLEANDTFVLDFDGTNGVITLT